MRQSGGSSEGTTSFPPSTVYFKFGTLLLLPSLKAMVVAKQWWTMQLAASRVIAVAVVTTVSMTTSLAIVRWPNSSGRCRFKDPGCGGS